MKNKKLSKIETNPLPETPIGAFGDPVDCDSLQHDKDHRCGEDEISEETRFEKEGKSAEIRIIQEGKSNIKEEEIEEGSVRIWCDDELKF